VPGTSKDTVGESSILQRAGGRHVLENPTAVANANRHR
jgi:hypothetical protein